MKMVIAKHQQQVRELNWVDISQLNCFWMSIAVHRNVWEIGLRRVIGQRQSFHDNFKIDFAKISRTFSVIFEFGFGGISHLAAADYLSSHESVIYDTSRANDWI